MKTTILSLTLFLLLIGGTGYMVRNENIPVLSQLGSDIAIKLGEEELMEPIIPNAVTTLEQREDLEIVPDEADILIEEESTQNQILESDINENNPVQEKKLAIESSPEVSKTCGEGAIGDILISKLQTCEPFICEFIHPLDGKTYTKGVLGYDADDNCLYSEQMPGDNLMMCGYSEEKIPSITNFYRTLNDGETIETRFSASFGDEGSDVDSATTVDGVEITNYSLQDALNDGTCKLV